MIKVISIALYMLMSTFGLIMIKIGTTNTSLGLTSGGFSFLMSWKFLIGFISYVCSFIIWTFVISKYDLSYIYPIVTALLFIIIMIASAVILKENISTNQIIGAIIIIIGVIITKLK